MRGRGAGREEQNDAGGRTGQGDAGDHDGQEGHEQGSHAVLSPGTMTRLTTARLSRPKNNSTANRAESMVSVRHVASAAHSSAVPPLHQVTQIRKRRNELPGVLVGCQPIVLPLALSQIAKTWAQPRAMPSGHTEGG